MKRTPVVAIWNELTPYRLHVMRRVESELADVRVTNLFTHSVTNNSMPWRMDLDRDLDVRFEESLRVPHFETYFHRNAFALARYVRRTVQEVRPAMVVMHGHNDFTRLMLMHGLRRAGFPLVHASDANMFDERYSPAPRAAVRRMYLRWILGKMDGYLPMGTGGRAFYRYFGRGDRPAFAFPYEPDYGLIQSEDAPGLAEFRRAHSLDPERRRFLYSGRLVGIKNVDLLVSAFIEVADELPDWDLVIAGDGPMRAKIVALVPPRLGHRVLFLGFQQMECLRHAYKACDVLVHLSVREPWALVINEAVASGMAVIASNVTGAAIDLVRNGVNGYLVTTGSKDETVSAMRRIARPGQVERMRSRSGDVLADWKQTADPVEGFRAAVSWFSRRGTAPAPA